MRLVVHNYFPARDSGFKEGDHPRGQPSNSGQFAPVGGGGGGSKAASKASPREMQENADLWNDYAGGDLIKQISRGEEPKIGSPGSSGHALTKEEVTTAKRAATQLQMLAESSLITAGGHGVYRGLALPEETDVKKMFPRNKVVELDSLTAVSRERDVANKYTDPQFIGEERATQVILNFQRRGGVIGADVSAAEYMDEAVMPKGAKYRVSGIKSESGYHIVTLYDNGTLNKQK